MIVDRCRNCLVRCWFTYCHDPGASVAGNSMKAETGSAPMARWLVGNRSIVGDNEHLCSTKVKGTTYQRSLPIDVPH